MSSLENLAWRSNQGQVSNGQALFKGSMARNNSPTGPPPQGIFLFGSSSGNHNQLTDESQIPISSVLNYDTTDYNTPDHFTPSLPSLPNFENGPNSSKSSSTQNPTSFSVSASAMGRGEMNIVSVSGSDFKIPQKRAPMKSHSKGSGINLGGHDKERKSPLRPRVEDKVIGKKKVASGRSRLAEALDHLESVGELLEPHNHLLAIVTKLEESIIKHMARKTRSKTALGSWDVDSAYQSMSRSSATEETDSVAASFDLTLDSHSCSSRAPVDDSHSDQMDMGTEIETPRATQPKIIIYHCIFQKPGKTCDYSTTRKGDWIRHGESEDHFPQKRYMCILCTPSLDDDNGNQICCFCYTTISVFGNNKLHYLQCQQAQKGKHIFAGAREEHFKSHLRKQHGLTGIGIEQSSWTFNVQSDWPSECGFCGERFSSFQARTDHIAAHFQEGADISSWRLPFGKGKTPHDHRPSIDYQRWNGDDDDDDDDGDNGFGGGGKGFDLHLFLNSSGSSGSGSGHMSSSTGYDLPDWSPAFFDGNVFQMRSRGYDSKLKVEDYLKHQLLSDQPSDFEDDSQTSDACSDTQPDSVETPLKYSPAKESSKDVAYEDGESTVEQSNISYCQAESKSWDENIDYQRRIKLNPNKEKHSLHFHINPIGLDIIRKRFAEERQRCQRKYTPRKRKEATLVVKDPVNTVSLASDTNYNSKPRARKRSTLVFSDTEVNSDSGSFKRMCISRSARKKRNKPFQCVFTFAGCHSAFSTKNEWKRHVFTQYMNLQTNPLYQSCPPSSCLPRALQSSTATFSKKVELNESFWNWFKNTITELAKDGQAFGLFKAQVLARFQPGVPAFITTYGSRKLHHMGMRNLSILRSSHLETLPEDLDGNPSQMSGLDLFLPSPATTSSEIVMGLTKYMIGHCEEPFLQWLKFTRQDQSTFKPTQNEHAFPYLIGEIHAKISASNQQSNMLLHLLFHGGYAYYDWPASNCENQPRRNASFKNSNCEYYPDRHYSAIEAASGSACQGDILSQNSNRYHTGGFRYRISASNLVCEHSSNSLLVMIDTEGGTSQKYRIYSSKQDYDREIFLAYNCFFKEIFEEVFVLDFSCLVQDHYSQFLDEQHGSKNAHAPTHLPGTDDQGWSNHGGHAQWWERWTCCQCYLDPKNYHGEILRRFRIEWREPKSQMQKIIPRTMIKFDQADLLDVGSDQRDLGPDGDHGEPRWSHFGPAIGPGYPNCPSCDHYQCFSKQD
jgi:hypothetical protein